MLSPLAESITAVDLNTAELARTRAKDGSNLTFVEADIAEMSLGRQFDIVFSVGVARHTDDPDRTVRNLAAHVRPGGKLVLWVYSREGNALVEHVVEPIRRRMLWAIRSGRLRWISRIVTALMYVPEHTVYRLPLRTLPYYEDCASFRRLRFGRNVLNVYDKLNAPQTRFIDEARIRRWFAAEAGFKGPHISRYCGVS